MPQPDFSKRSTASELMDETDISFEEFHHCLSELETINVLTLAYRPTLQWLKKFKEKNPLAVLDVGSGGGDMLRKIAGAGRLYSLNGVDLNPWSKKSAELHVKEKHEIVYHTADAFSFSLQNDFDVIISSLTAHHLNEEQIIRLLRWMSTTARHGWFINDLHRHPLPYYFIKYTTRLFSRNRLIRHDAAVSVARAFTRQDWQGLLDKAGIDGTIQWFFPFRICVSCVK